jgi:hypothetical protein
MLSLTARRIREKEMLSRDDEEMTTDILCAFSE